MSFWMGMARAYQDADEKKTQDRRLQEERDFLKAEKASDRKWEEDFFFRKLRAETDAERQNLLLRGGSSRRGSGSGSGSSDSTVSLQALVKQHPELDPALVAKLAPYPDLIEEVFSSLNDRKEAWATGRQAWTPELSNNFIRDVVPEGDEELTSERIQSIAEMYGVDPAAEVYSGSGTTWGDVISQTEGGGATLITDPMAAPDPMKPEQQRLFSEQIGSRISGQLQNQLTALNAEWAAATDPTSGVSSLPAEEAAKLRQEISAIESLIEQVDGGKGYMDEALNSEYGTKVVQEMFEAGNTFDYRRMFPGFKPHFASPEEAKAALSSGFIQPNQPIMVLVDGTYKQARF